MKKQLVKIKEEIENLSKDNSLSEEERYQLINLYNDIKSVISNKQNELENDFFIIDKVEDNLVIIYANSYRNPSEQWNRIEERLKGFHGKIVMDCLLSNGYGNRLFEIEIKENESLNLKRNFKHLSNELNLKLKKEKYLDDFYKKNPQILEYGTLSNSEKMDIIDSFKNI
jgi:hypothetical protein